MACSTCSGGSGSSQSSISGSCGDTIINKQLYNVSTFINYYIVAYGEGQTTSSTYLFNSFIAAEKKYKSSAYNAIKSAIASAYLASMYVLLVSTPLATTTYTQGVIDAYTSPIVCWIVSQKAYDGPCADLVENIANLYSNFIKSALGSLQPLLPNNDLAVAAYAGLNATIDTLIKKSNCCYMTPPNIQVPTFTIIPN